MATVTIYDPDDSQLIQAATESGLAAEYADDPVLLRFYMKKLMQRGWAGTFDPVEKRYTQLVRKALGTGQSEEQLEAMKNRLAAHRHARAKCSENLRGVIFQTKAEEQVGGAPSQATTVGRPPQ